MKPLHLIIAIGVVCMWGLNFSVIKAGVDTIDPLILMALRFVFVVFPAIFFVPRPNVPWRYLLVYGLTFGVGVWGLMSLSIAFGLSAGMASVILESSAFISVLLGLIFLRERISRSQLFGICIALLGLGLVLVIEDGTVTLLGFILAILASVSLSCVGFIVRKAQIKQMFAFVVWSSIFIPIPLLTLSYLLNGESVFLLLPERFNQITLFSILIQAYPVTLLGYWLWNRLQTIYPLSIMAPLTLLVPIFGLLGSVLVYGEQLEFIKILSTGLIVTGVAWPGMLAFLKFCLADKKIRT